MKKVLLSFIVLFTGLVNSANSQTIHLQYDTSSSQAEYAAKMLVKSLVKKGYQIKNKQADYSIALIIEANTLSGEAYSILPEDKKITIKGGDGRGIIYGCLSLAEEFAQWRIYYQTSKAQAESPKLAIPRHQIRPSLGYIPA